MLNILKKTWLTLRFGLQGENLKAIKYIMQTFASLTSLILCEMDLSKEGEMCAQYDGDAQALNDKLLVQQ